MNPSIGPPETILLKALLWAFFGGGVLATAITYFVNRGRKTSNLAKATLFLAVFGLATLIPLFIAIPVGHKALREIRRSGGALQGRGQAWFGLLCGYGAILAITFQIFLGVQDARREENLESQRLNLETIEQAKAAWASEKNKLPGDTPSAADLAPFMPGGHFPPANGGGEIYQINPIGAKPTVLRPPPNPEALHDLQKRLLWAGFGISVLAAAITYFVNRGRHASALTKAPHPETAIPPDIKVNEASTAKQELLDVTKIIPEKPEEEVTRGLESYRTFQDRMANEVSPAQAEAVQRALRRGTRAFLFTLVAFALLGAYNIFGSAILRLHHPLAAYALRNLIDISIFTAVLVLISCFGIPIAGRIGVPLWLVLISSFYYGAPTVYWSRVSQSAEELLPMLGTFFLLGWLMDFGATADAFRKKRFIRKVCLCFLACILWQINSWRGEDSGRLWYEQLLVMPHPLILFIWAWVAVPFIEHRKHSDPDHVSLYKAAASRWVRLFLGRVLAIGIAAFPFFLFLNCLGLEERMGLATRGEVVETRTPAGVMMWVWKSQGRLLRPDDFEKEKIYGLSRARGQPSELKRIAELSNVLVAQPTNTIAFEQLALELQPFRIRNDQEFAQLCNTTNELFIMMLEKTRMGPNKANPQGRYFCGVNDGDIVWTASDGINPLLEALDSQKWALFVVGLLGFGLLWRRGGDSGLGLAISLWLMATTISSLSLASGCIIPWWKHFLWAKAMTSPIGSLALFLAGFLEAFTSSIGWLHAEGFVLSALWVTVCWPSSPPRYLGVWGLRILWLLKVLLVAFAFGGIREIVQGTGDWHSDYLFGPVAPVTHAWATGISTVLFLFGGKLVRAFVGRKRALLPLGKVHVLSFISFQAWTITSSLGLKPWSSPITQIWMHRLTWVCFLLFVLLAIFTVVRTGFLHVCSGEDMSKLVVLGAAPLVFTHLELWTHHALLDTAWFSELGVTVLSGLITIAIVAPAHRVFEHLFLFMSVPRLHRIQKDVEHAIETIVEAEHDAEKCEEIARLFRDWGIHEYALFSRTPKGFQPTISKLNWPVPDQVAVSGHLRTFLGRKRKFIHLREVPHEWAAFFYQFELYRIERATKCEYLLPICLGNSVRGLLLLPEGKGQQSISKDPWASEISNLGAAVVRT